MSSNDLWITTRITEARKNNPSVTNAASARIEELLGSGLSERQFTPKELKSTAAALIADMASISPKAKR
jgi:hypothetical protein